MKHSEAQILPVPRGEWASGDDEEVIAAYDIEFRREKEALKVEAISPDSDFDHTITVRITMLPAYIAMPYLFVADLVKIMKRLLGLE